LPNGLIVLVREDPTVGVMGASLMVRGGTLFEAPDEAGITNFMHRVMVRGTRRYDAVQLTQAIEDLGGSLDASGDVEYAEVRGTALGRNWEALLTLIAEVALRPTFPSEEVERERRLILSAIQSRGDTPFQRAFDAMLADLYGRHGYGWPNVGTRGLARLDRAASKRATGPSIVPIVWSWPSADRCRATAWCARPSGCFAGCLRRRRRARQRRHRGRRAVRGTWWSGRPSRPR
jgi:hypothetical protein